MKKFTAVLLTVLMLFTLVPISAFAASGPYDKPVRDLGGASLSFLKSEEGKYYNILGYDESGGLAVHNDAVPGASYDLATNTLTITNLNAPDDILNAWYMGDDFKLRVEGECSFGSISVYNYFYLHSASLSITGTGKLTLNKNKTYSAAISLHSDGKDPMKVDIADSVTVDLYAQEKDVIRIYGTTVESKDEAITQGGRPIEGVTGGRYIYEQAEMVPAFYAYDLGWDYDRGYLLTKNDDPDGIYTVYTSTDSEENIRYYVSKYVYLEEYDVYLRDWSADTGSITEEELNANYTFVQKPQPEAVYYTSDWNEEHNRGMNAYQVTKADDPDAVYCAQPEWNGAEEGDPDFYTVSRVFWDEDEEIYVKDSSFETVSCTAEEFAASDFELCYREVTDKAQFASWSEVDTAPDETVNSLQNDTLVRRESDPDGIYIQTGTYTSYVGGELVAEGYIFKSVYYDETYGAYYRDLEKVKGTEDFLVPYTEFEDSEFSFVMETRTEKIPLRFITENYAFEDYAYCATRAKKADDPDGVYAVDEYKNSDGELSEYYVARLVYNEEKGHYYENSYSYLTPEEYESAGYSYELVPQPVKLKSSREYMMTSLPVCTDAAGNRYLAEEYDERHRVFNYSSENTVELFGEPFCLVTLNEGVKYEDLTKEIQLVESDIFNYKLESAEYHHTGSGTPEPQLIKGDVNGDGRVDINDATLVQQCAAELVTFTDAQKSAGDTNGDGKVDINDATRIQQFAAEIIQSFDE